MKPEEAKTINLFEEFGVSDERAHEINMEIRTIWDDAEFFTEIIREIPEKYDRESIILGVFLCERILDNGDRLLPANVNATILAIPEPAKEILDELLKDIESELEELKISPKGDPENN